MGFDYINWLRLFACTLGWYKYTSHRRC